MVPAVKWVYLVALATWVGSQVFFSVVVVPTVFRVLGREEAARLQRALFPPYHLLGLICAGVGIVCIGWLLVERAFGKWPGIFSLLLLAATVVTEFWVRQTLLPRLNELQELKSPVIGSGQVPQPERIEEWKSLHRLSVQLNAAVLFCGLTLLFLIVFARVA